MGLFHSQLMERGAGHGEKSLNPQNDEVLSFSVVPPTPPLPIN
jgi:hypothetical protein